MMVEIRRAVLTDVEQLRVLSIISFQNAYGAFNTEADMRNYVAANFNAEHLSQELAREHLVFLVAIDGNEIVGYCKLDTQTEIAGVSHALEIARLYTAPSRIGEGIGAQLVAAAGDVARQHNFSGLCLGVWQKNYRAVNFYQREGFQITGVTTFTLGADVQDDFVMGKPI